ncbi:surface antigen gene [Jejuia pallidilutea]|uniref:Surface antigen protein n=1 Tax=Jejuia pallidilutea TaxID=504487 RepID=A0A090VXN6_9FLAO|nr:surface antigen gene [Jejuia pallidilutea]
MVASIKALKADVIAIEEDIEELELKLPCETDQVKINAILAKIDALEIALQAANDAITEDIRESIADLENQISNLPAGTVNDQNVIVAFPGPGTYKVALKVTDNNGWSNTIDENITIIEAVPTIPVPEIGEPSFEDNSLPDGTGDGRDSWRVPSNSAWSPTGGGTTVIQINTDTNPVDPPNLPDGRQAAKFPAGGSRVAYQEIEVTPGAEYVLTYHSAFEVTQYADLKVSILKPETSNYAESLLEDNIIASRTDNNIDRVDNIWRQHALSFEAGDNESVIIFVTNSGDESRLDFFEILVKQ